ncbi:MAG: hypothetical protein ABFD92_19815 [Planctomycetaceae bacterium]|nr:hypothetical protein [Planctomycetaceae bacterium]
MTGARTIPGVIASAWFCMMLVCGCAAEAPASRGVEVVFAPAQARKVLTLEAPGEAPDRVAVVIPTITRPGMPFEARVAVLDKWGYPSVKCSGRVRLIGSDGAVVAAVEFRPGVAAVAAVRNLHLEEEGFHRLTARLQGREFPSNPTRCTAARVEDIFWGDPHAHSLLGQCMPKYCRSIEFAYASARYVSGLDWLAMTDHVSTGRGSEALFYQETRASELHNDPPAFVTVPAYEASLQGGAGGDNNIYMSRWPAMYVDEYENGNVKTLCEKLTAVLGREGFFVVPHHTTRVGKHGEIPDGVYPGPAAMPCVEIHSKWGTSEYRGNPNALVAVHPGPSYVQDLLGRGLRLGFMGGSDSHAGMPGGGGREPGNLTRLSGLTAVRAAALDRQSIFMALRERNCYAASGERIYLDASIAGAGGGSRQVWKNPRSPRSIEVTAAGQSDIETIEIVRNGSVIHRRRCDSWQAAVHFDDVEDAGGLWLPSKHMGRCIYYYVRVTCRGGAQAWSSPVWLVESIQ